ncbi:MAG: hypothetical protein ACNA8W_10405, partial [Bradymonadaceae bacterium]
VTHSTDESLEPESRHGEDPAHSQAAMIEDTAPTTVEEQAVVEEAVLEEAAPKKKAPVPVTAQPPAHKTPPITEAKASPPPTRSAPKRQQKATTSGKTNPKRPVKLDLGLDEDSNDERRPAKLDL